METKRRFDGWPLEAIERVRDQAAATLARAPDAHLIRPEAEASLPALAFRSGWQAALSGLTRDACPYPSDDPLYRDAWHEGYSDAERER